MNLVSLSLRSALAVLLLGSLAACGGGGGSSGGGNAAPQPLSGVVVDPAIAGASVTLRSSSGSALAAVVVTDLQGRFSLSVPAGASLSGAVLSSRGGEDVETGYPFRNAVLSAPVTGEGAVVSLLSTLVQQQVEDGASLEAATQAVADWFGLAPAEVLGDPRESAAAQRVSLTLSGWLNALRDEETPMTRIGAALRSANGDPALARQALADDARAASTADNLAHFDELAARFDAGGATSAEEVVARFTRANLFVGITRHIDEYIGALNLDDPVIAANVDALVDAIWEANGRRGVPQDSARVINLARYALTEGDIALADLADSAFSVPDLAGDRINQIAAARDAIDHTLPLAPGEYLGMDNERRLAYFYASDLSPFYQAERLFDGVTDDAVLDPLYQSIAQGQARAGLLDQALVTLEARIFQASARVDAMRTIGLRLSEAGRPDDAENMMRAAVDQANRIVDAKGGAGFIDNTEVNMLIKILENARMIGRPDIAGSAVEPLYQFAQINAGNGDVRTLYGRVIAALGNASGAGPVPQAVMAYENGSGSLVAAQELVAVYKAVIFGTPAQANGTHPVKGMYLAILADYEDRLGLDPWEAVDAFHDLRAQGTNLDSNIRFLADIYGRHDRVSEYLSLAESISSSSLKNRALQVIAVWQAIKAGEEGGVEEAINTVVANIAELSGQVDVLLWAGRNGSDKGLALRMQEKGERDLAAAVVEHVSELVLSDEWVQAYPESAASLGHLGCAKAAYAWYRIGETERGENSLDACLDFVIDYAWPTDALRYQAYLNIIGYQLEELGDLDRTGDLAELMLPLVERDNITDTRSNLGVVARKAALGGRDVVVQQALQQAMATLPVLPLPAGDQQSDRNAKVLSLTTFASVLANVRDDLRSRIALDGPLDETRQEVLDIIKAGLGDILLDEHAPLASEALLLNSTDQRAGALQAIAEQIARTGNPGEAAAVANLIEFRPNREKALGAVALRIVTHDDFPGSLFASRDLDGDGRPDFFDPVEGNAGTNPFELDDDIDGDGCRDDQDRRPFLATDGLADCAA